MHPAKKFFYVSAALCSLALTYHVGARNASAQSSTVECAEVATDTFAATAGRIVYAAGDQGSGTPLINFQTYPPVPGTSPIVAVKAPTNGFIAVMLANGDVYWANGFQVWTYAGNILSGGAVNVEKHTLGQLKARFRDPKNGVR